MRDVGPAFNGGRDDGPSPEPGAVGATYIMQSPEKSPRGDSAGELGRNRVSGHASKPCFQPLTTSLESVHLPGCGIEFRHPTDVGFRGGEPSSDNLIWDEETTRTSGQGFYGYRLYFAVFPIHTDLESPARLEALQAAGTPGRRAISGSTAVR